MKWSRALGIVCPKCHQKDATKTNGSETKCFRCNVSIKVECPEVAPTVSCGTVRGRVGQGALDLGTVIDAEVDTWHQALLQQPTHLEYLRSQRSLTLDVIQRLKLGYVAGRILIPVPDGSGGWANVRSASPGEKLRGLNGRPVGLFPLPLPGKRVLLTEGEWDCLAALSLGVSAITGTGGASCWKDEWSQSLAGMRVDVCYDNDTPGRKGAAYVAKSLSALSEVRLVRLPEGVKDLSDWCKAGHTGAELQALLDGAALINKPTAIESPDDPPENVFQTTLHGAGLAENHGKWCEFRVVSVATGSSPYLLPKVIEVNCGQDQGKSCQRCAMVDEPSMPVIRALDIQSQDYLSLTNISSTVLDKAIRTKLGIAPSCKTVEIVAKESLMVTENRVTESLHTETDSSQDMRLVFGMGMELQPNKEYRVIARTLVEPTNQKVVHVVHSAQTAVDEVSQFKYSAKVVKKLKPGKNLDKHILKLLEDASRITGIWQRSDLHLLILLAYHTPLWLSWDSESDLIKGWADVLVIGDTGQGKTTAAERLRQWIGLGERCVLKRVTIAGLLGGRVEDGRRTWISWGVDPRCDQKLVVYEEVKGADPQVLASLTDGRSAGYVSVNLAGHHNLKASARTRRIWISNPRRDRALGEHGYGVLAVKELFCSPEDVRRLDMVVFVGNKDVDQGCVGRERTQDPAILTREALRHSVLNAWSQYSVAIPKDVRDEARKQADTLAAKFSSRVPLIEGSDHRLKLARLGAALANLVQEPVSPKHIEYIAKWQDTCYSSKTAGYFDFSDAIRREGTVVEPDNVGRSLNALENPAVIMRYVLQRASMHRIEFADLVGGDRMMGDSLLSLLVRHNCLQRTSGSLYTKTEGFVSFLRERLDNVNN